MERFKYILKRTFCLPPLPTVLIALPSFTLCFSLLAARHQGLLAYISYGLSAYALVITVTGFAGIIKGLRAGIRSHPVVRRLLGLPFGKRFFEDAGFRAELSLYQGFFICLFYIILKMLSGIYYRSLWLVSLAVYYSLLALIRFLLLCHVNKRTPGSSRVSEWRRYRLCGIMLLFMNQALAGIVGFIVYQNRGYDYPGFLIYAVAVYTFYITIIAVVQLVRFKRYGSPLLSAAKAVNLAAAMVSMLSLTTAMLAQFGEDDAPFFRRIMTGAVGGGVCLLVLGIAIVMIVRSTKQLKQLRDDGRVQA